MTLRYLFWSAAMLLAAAGPAGADVGNRLAYLDQFCDPFYPTLQTARLTTPQWAGEPGVEAAIVLAIDDLRDSKVHEKFLRPIFERLKKIDGRAPVSLMTCNVDADDPQLQTWLKEGATLEAHTVDHPCPCLQGGNLAKAKDTYDRAIDMLARVPGNQAVAFRMPCCDSMNSVSPRFFTEIFNRRTPEGRFLRMNSSVFMVYTAADPVLPRELALEPDGRGRFKKYLPDDRPMINYVQDYPYPWVIGGACWEIAPLMPSDWDAQHRNGKCSPKTVEDLKAAVDATVHKQGVFSICFHAHGWIANEQIIQVIDHAVAKHGRKVKFFNFREVHDLLTRNVLGGVPLRADDGGPGGMRVLDLNADGFMDVVIGNGKVRQTRAWSPESGTWTVSDFPVRLVEGDGQGRVVDTGVRFGVLQKSGMASLLVCNENTKGLWHFDGRQWVDASAQLEGLELDGPVRTSLAGRDQGVRFRDLDLDGVCELIVAGPKQQAVFRYEDGPAPRWRKLPWSLPEGTAIVDAEGRDAGLRLVDVDEDGLADVVFSNAQRYRVHLFTGMERGWSRKVLGAERGEKQEVPPIVRADGTNNGAWFKHRHMWVQNEETGAKLPHHIEVRPFAALAGRRE